MIDPKELRIGNYIGRKSTGAFCRVNWGIIRDADLHCDVGDYEYIILSPEILEKCGFSERYDTGLYRKGKENLFLHHFIMDDYYCFMYNDYKSYPLKYLHQLQNLYYCLVGEELQVNL